MRVLLLGGTGNLGSRLIPALSAHGHVVVAYVRSVSKLQTTTTSTLFEKIETYEGNALDSTAVEDAIRRYDCDAIVNTAGTREPLGKEQTLGKIATSVSSAAIRVGKDRGRPLRAWFIGGLGSLEYPGTGGWKIQDYMPGFLTIHHRETEQVMRAIPTTDLQWSLLCVAIMQPDSDKVEMLSAPRRNNLAVAAHRPPEWQDHWIRNLPFIGVYLNIVPTVRSYTTRLEDVADLIAEDLEKANETMFVGELVGMKDRIKSKTP